MFAKVLSYIKEKENFEKIIFWFLIAFVILTGVILRIKVYFYNQSFWLDEGLLGCNLVEKSYHKFFRPLQYGQAAPPFFMIISKFFYNIVKNTENLYYVDYAVRFVPFVSSVMILPLFYYVVSKMYNNKLVIATSLAIVGLNSALISYSAQFKQYSTETLFCVILLAVFLNMNISHDTVKKTILCSLVLCLAPWFSFSSFFILFGGNVLLIYYLVKDKFKGLLNFAILFLIQIANFTAFFFLHYRPINKVLHDYMQNYWQNSLPSFFALTNFPNMFIEKTINLIYFPYHDFLILFLVMNLFILITSKNCKNIILILVPLLSSILASFAHLYPYEQRLILFLVPIYAMIFVQFLQFFKSNKNVVLPLYACVLFVTIYWNFKPIEDFIKPKNYTRELVKIINSINGSMKEKIYVAGGTDLIYYNKEFKEIEIDNIWEKFDRRKYQNKLNAMSPGKIKFVIFSHNSLTYKKNNDIKNFLKNNPQIKVVGLVESPYDDANYLLAFMKI